MFNTVEFSSCKALLFMSYLMTLGFSRQIIKKYSHSKFHENPSKVAELFYAGWQTDVTKLLVTFRKFATKPVNGTLNERNSSSSSSSNNNKNK